MSFWGIEVKPGKPVTHSCEKARGRLRITQANLGISEASKKSIVQCNVGKRSPVLLCTLIPDKTESFQLDLEFAEADDVVFSVIGPRSVYLCGYYVAESRPSGAQSDSESFGVDIQNSHSEESSNDSDDDDYEDSFIDDGELKVLPPSPVSSDKSMDEPDSEKDKKKARKSSRGQLRKKRHLVISDDESDSHDNADKDRSVSRNKSAEKKTTSKVQKADAQPTAETRDNAKDNSLFDESDDDDDGSLLSLFKNKKAGKKTMSDAQKKKDQETLETGDNAKDNGRHDNKLKEEVGPQVASGKDEREADAVQDKKVTQVKNKKKKLPKEVETLPETTPSKNEISSNGNIQENVEVSRTNQNIPTSDTNNQIDTGTPKRKRKDRCKKDEKTNDVEINKDHSEHEVEASKNMDSNSGHKSKKRRKEVQVEGICTEGIVETCHDVPAGDKPEQRLLDTDSSMKDLPGANGVSFESKTNNEPVKKSKKKSKKKTQDENQGTSDIPANKRTLSNGLSIEVLANGLPDGKVAAPGKKVKIYYTATVKETGHILDSNLGKSALKFRLGQNEFTDEWNAGIEGMHVGEKRRLVVPPSLGFKNHEENVPPNSWLVYEVELVGVH